MFSQFDVSSWNVYLLYLPPPQPWPRHGCNHEQWRLRNKLFCFSLLKWCLWTRTEKLKRTSPKVDQKLHSTTTTIKAPVHMVSGMDTELPKTPLSTGWSFVIHRFTKDSLFLVTNVSASKHVITGAVTNRIHIFVQHPVTTNLSLVLLSM